MTTLEPPPSFSTARKWSISLNVLVLSLTVLALVLMFNYLAARHFTRFAFSQQAQVVLSPLTLKVLGGLTNEVKVIVYFNKQEPLYDSVLSLLKDYKFRNSKISLELVDYERDPGIANLIKNKYKLNKVAEKDLVIFDCNGRTKFVYETELSDLDIQPMINQQGPPRRTHFKGELMFTSAIFSVTSAGPLKAYFLRDHGEHLPDDTKEDLGFGRFADLLRQNNIEWSRLSLLGTNDVPTGSLLIVAGGNDLLSLAESGKIDRYLKNGGRMLALFNLFSADKTTGLERILADWGVEVGKNVVRDKENSATQSGRDVANSAFGNHAITTPLFQTRVDMIEPRSIRKAPESRANADAPNVTELVFTGPEGTVITDTHNGVVTPHSTDLRTNVCLAVAVEKGKIKNVSADRGTTRIVVVGDSLLWDNQMLDQYGNRDFASLAVNWLLDRSELLAIQHHPIKEYKLTMTKSQLTTVIWLMVAGMPGGVLLVGLLVWARRRR